VAKAEETMGDVARAAVWRVVRKEAEDKAAHEVAGMVVVQVEVQVAVSVGGMEAA